MKLYRKIIRPMHCYPGQSYEPKTEPVEKEEKWYPEEERERLEQVYGYLNEGHFSDLVFEEKYEPYAVEPQFKKLKVPEKCKECKSCQAAMDEIERLKEKVKKYELEKSWDESPDRMSGCGW